MTTQTTAPPGAGAEHDANEALAEILFSPEGRIDPYARYHRLRAAAPVHRSPMGMWALTRYQDVFEALRDKRVGKDVHAFLAGRFSGEWEQHAALRRLASTMLWANPPEHTRMRRIVNAAFTKERVLRHRAFVERRVAELLQPFIEAGGGDICNDFCYLLPISVVAGLVGVPQEEAPGLRAPIRDFQRTFELGMTALELRVADEAAEYLDDYFRALVARKRREPGDDLLSALIAAEDDDPLDDGELAVMCHMLIAAGSETATHFLDNGIRLFIEHPDQAELVRRDPALLTRAIEEVLRYDPPVHILPRTVSEPLEVNGLRIPAGSRLMLLIAAANRDPERFTDPDVFDVTRDQGMSISFGAGIHGCPGWRLARLQAEAVFGTLLRRFPQLEITEPPRPQPRVTLPGLEALRVRLGPDAGEVR
ncbi:cytochrome P450 [Phaeacidiphilus oryzae]|uniref:cytochrome P450 n=1 Tax=Phaeacidiphilus oryzae TaxID=348818 RepID=UPI0006910BAA|nr:cytochrome P450 [Phaeacidiphilus oryzae]